MEGAAPPAACTAPWRPPVQLGSLGSLPPAAPPDSAGPAAPRHLPTGQGERLQHLELARQACPSLVPPGPLSALPGDSLALLVAPSPDCSGRPNPSWTVVPSASCLGHLSFLLTSLLLGTTHCAFTSTLRASYTFTLTPTPGGRHQCHCHPYFRDPETG